ncbi:helix-turn-helix psq domain [Holotrichia oblita]|uniref:Helix-turn-helix psq domain n=1 Tax=Holotrichia oblita TaxID=644536 RepID=A0ACB9TZL3_HOLOL|nr:helix-turn-helix psq domain [Holotrichia oblita]
MSLRSSFDNLDSTGFDLNLRTPGARTYRDYSEEAMLEAIEAVKAGMSKKLAAETFGVERTTFGRRIVGTHPKAVGRPTILTAQEEALIAKTQDS